MALGCKWLLSVFLLVSMIPVYAQEDTLMKGMGLECNFLAGKIIKHTHKFTAPIPSSSEALDLNLVWQTYGKKDWHQRWGYPQVGLGITYTDYGNNLVFGKCIGIYPNIQIPLVRGRQLEWVVRIGDGIAYVTKKYSRSNPVDTVNTAIGTHINDFGIFTTDLRYRMDKHWQVQFGANLTHISNADYHNPNLGVNMVGMHVGVRYFPEDNRPTKIKRDLPKLSNRWLTQLRVGVGFNEANATGNPELPTYVVSLYESRRWASKNKLFAGIDYAYHESTYAFYNTWGINIGKERETAWDGTIFVGNEFLVGRVGIIAQVGYYYRLTYLKYGNDKFNEKLGGNLYLIKHEKGILKELFITALLTTHMAVAEYAEFGIGAGI